MRRLIWIPVLALGCLVSRAYTQDTTTGAGHSINAERANQALTTARRTLFENNIELTDAQKDPFWTIYSQFEKERSEVTGKTLQLVQTYATNYSTLTNDQLMQMLKEVTANSKKQIDLRAKYADQIAKKVDPKIGTRFYQIDDYLSTAARLDVLDHIPFVGAKEKE
jgi:hypothetical protein